VTPKIPTVYFIDDSATMREVIKIAFRRENMQVIACHDGLTALEQMEQLGPDVVISDVIMPEKDGYQVCEHIKQHPEFGKTPVILMSGVVNRAVAERAFAVKADELIRKPFQPQDLIGRVKRLLNPSLPAAPPAAAISANAALSSIFAMPVAPTAPISRSPSPAPFVATATRAASPPPPVSTAAGPSRASLALPPPSLGASLSPLLPASPAPALTPQPALPAVPLRTNGNGSDQHRPKIEILRLEGLVHKLQLELEAEREYSRALESHIKTLQEG
jgi:CheY-like chemotaxis protein